MFSDLLHLSLHHFVLVYQLIVWNGTICFLVISSRVLLISLYRLCCSNFLLISLILRQTLIWINSRFVPFSFIIAKSCFKWIEILADYMLVVVIICSILWRHSTLRFVVAALRNYGCILTQNMGWRNLMFSLVILVEILRQLTFSMMVVMSTIGSSVLFSLLELLIIVLLKLLVVLNLLVSSEHTFNIVTWHWTRTRITIAI